MGPVIVSPAEAYVAGNCTYNPRNPDTSRIFDYCTNVSASILPVPSDCYAPVASTSEVSRLPFVCPVPAITQLPKHGSPCADASSCDNQLLECYDGVCVGIWPSRVGWNDITVFYPPPCVYTGEKCISQPAPTPPIKFTVQDSLMEGQGTYGNTATTLSVNLTARKGVSCRLLE